MRTFGKRRLVRSDLTEITETEDQGAILSTYYHGNTLGTDPSGLAALLEGGDRIHTVLRCVYIRRQHHTPGQAGCEMEKRDPRNRGRSIRANIDDTTRQQPFYSNLTATKVCRRLAAGSRRFRAPQSRTGCTEYRMTKMEDQQGHRSIRRSHSVVSILGSLTAACRWGKPRVDAYAEP